MPPSLQSGAWTNRYMKLPGRFPNQGKDCRRTALVQSMRSTTVALNPVGLHDVILIYVHPFAASSNYVLGPLVIVLRIVGRANIANGWLVMTASP